jgi:hypothetical protein
MTVIATAGIIAAACVLIALIGFTTFALRPSERRAPKPPPSPSAGRILFPFVALALSARALDAALRLARAEDAVLVPVFLAPVPLHIPLDSPLARQSETAVALLETIEQRAASWGVDVDARVQRGRTTRHALRQAIQQERFDRIVVAAAVDAGPGFGPDDVAWLLAHAPGEIVVLRPAAGSSLAVVGHASVSRPRPPRGAPEARPARQLSIGSR